MKKYNIKKDIFIKDKNNIYNMTSNILISLIPFIIFITYKNGIYKALNDNGNIITLFSPLIYIIIAILVGLIVEYSYNKIKKGNKNIDYPSIILSEVLMVLIMPENIKIKILIFGSIIVGIIKIINNSSKIKLNSTAVGLMFITMIYNSKSYDYLLQGNIEKYIFIVLIIISYIYLIKTKSIKYQIPFYYIITIIVICFIVCLINNININFILYNILLNNLIFISIYLLSDSETSPITNYGMAVGGILLGIITMIIRYLIKINQDTIISVIIFNLLTVVINYLSIKLYNNKILKIIILALIVIMIIPLSLIISLKI